MTFPDFLPVCSGEGLEVRPGLEFYYKKSLKAFRAHKTCTRSGEGLEVRPGLEFYYKKSLKAFRAHKTCNFILAR